MKHAIATLELALETVLTNEPINRREGRIAQADQEAEAAAELKLVLATLRASEAPARPAAETISDPEGIRALVDRIRATKSPVEFVETYSDAMGAVEDYLQTRAVTPALPTESEQRCLSEVHAVYQRFREEGGVLRLHEILAAIRAHVARDFTEQRGTPAIILRDGGVITTK